MPRRAMTASAENVVDFEMFMRIGVSLSSVVNLSAAWGQNPALNHGPARAVDSGNLKLDGRLDIARRLR